MKKEEGKGPGLIQRKAGGKEAKAISFMPETSDERKIQMVWGRMNAYRQELESFPEQIGISLEDGNPEEARDLCFSFALHLSIANRLAACLISERMQQDSDLSIEFDRAMESAMELLERRYSPESFVATRFEDFAFQLNSLCRKCDVTEISDNAREVYETRREEVESLANVTLD